MFIRPFLNGKLSSILPGLALALLLAGGTFEPAQAITYNDQVSHDDDDAEEATGAVTLGGTDLDIGDTTVGVRFDSVDIPANATITNAYMQFKTPHNGETNTTCTMTITGDYATNSARFQATGNDITGRTSTTASVSWTPSAWNNDDTWYDTPDLSSIMSEIIANNSWAQNNAVTFIISTCGNNRAADSHDSGGGSDAPKLVVEYNIGLVLAVGTANWTPTGTAQTSTTITVTNSAGTGAIDFTISDNKTWITTSITSGTTDTTFTITVDANSTGSSRSGVVTITATTASVANTPQTIDVIQAAQSSSSSSASSLGTITSSDYETTPIFMGTSVTPNVLVILDNSGSMNCQAYHHLPCNGPESSWDTTYSSLTTYYGYFDSTKTYAYASNTFSETSGAGWNGNFLNWLSMRRIDIAKKVLFGGKSTPRPSNINDPHTYYGESATGNWEYFKKIAMTDGDGVLWPAGVCGSATYCYFGMDAGYIHFDDASDPINTYLGRYQIKINVPTGEPGIIHSVTDKVRFGIENFNSSDGGYLTDMISDPRTGAALSSLITNLDNLSASTSTPLAEALYTGVGYFAMSQVTDISTGPRYFSSAPKSYAISGSGLDPYEFGAPTNGTVPCCKSFVLLLTDGIATSDGDLPASIQSYYNGATNGYLDDVALFGHTTDLRPAAAAAPLNSPSPLTGDQQIILYTINMFGGSTAANDLIEASKAGGFEDSNGNGLPDLQSEWDVKDNDTGDFTPDGVPDTYFQADNGDQLLVALNRAFSEILSRASSGTAISVLATSASGAGNVYQAYFLPSKTVSDADGTRDLAWLGHLLSLNVDTTGHLRDASDNCIKFEFDTAANQTYIKTLSENASTGVCTTSQTGSQPLTSFTGYNWEAGNSLLTRTATTRTLYTFVDFDQDGVCDSCSSVDTGEWRTLDTSIASYMQGFLRAGDVTEAENIINYTRGSLISGYRSKAISGNQWKLGDIVYSTPTVMSAPQEGYGLIYQDTTYTSFYNTYAATRTADPTVFVGSNDGLLHAFKATTGYERWAYVPYNLLPHLKWQAESSYLHQDGVDLKVKLTDVNMGTAASPSWKTILIGGFRMGGGEIDNDGYPVSADPPSTVRKWRSAYFALDVTDADTPIPLWEFGHNLTTFGSAENDLGFSMSYPAVVKVGDNFFAIFGSGGQAAYTPVYDGTPNQAGKVFVVNIKTGALAKVFEVAGDTVSFFGDPISTDIDFSTTNAAACPTCGGAYGSEAVYIGETYYKSTGGGSWNGRLWRIVTNNTDPANWVMYNMFNTQADQSIVAAPASSPGSSGDTWIFFGSGKYYSTADKTDSTQQTMYGIKEPCWDKTNLQWDNSCLALSSVSSDASYTSPSISLADLYNSTNVSVFSATNVTGAAGGASTFEGLEAEVAAKSGWYMNLEDTADPTERVINKASVLGGLILFTSFVPDSDICGYSGASYFYSLFYETGTAYKTSTIGTDATTGEVLKRSASSSIGLASSVAIHAGEEEGAKAYIQLSTGEAVAIEVDTALNIKSRIISWREL